MHDTIIKKDFRGLTREELTCFFQGQGLKPFKGKQVWEWVWKKHVLDFDKMTNISIAERKILKDNFLIKHIKTRDYQCAKDGTIKVAFILEDGHLVEGVLIPGKNRVTACISSQVGCGFGCRFCATGQMGFIRNLKCYEIYDQVVLLQDLAEKKFDSFLTNIVLMGMGEPLANYDNVINAINLICHQNAMAISPSRITLSTAGIISGINKLAKDKVKFNLAVSLHSVVKDTRDKLMPLNRRNSLNDLASSLKNFYKVTNTRVTVEYLLIADINDSAADAIALAKYCRQFPSKINIIEFNPVENIPFKRPAKKVVDNFLLVLEKHNLVVNTRRSRGGDLDAACGQLAIKKQDRNPAIRGLQSCQTKTKNK